MIGAPPRSARSCPIRPPPPRPRPIATAPGSPTRSPRSAPSSRARPTPTCRSCRCRRARRRPVPEGRVDASHRQPQAPARALAVPRRPGQRHAARGHAGDRGLVGQHRDAGGLLRAAARPALRRGGAADHRVAQARADRAAGRRMRARAGLGRRGRGHRRHLGHARALGPLPAELRGHADRGGRSGVLGVPRVPPRRRRVDHQPAPPRGRLTRTAARCLRRRALAASRDDRASARGTRRARAGRAPDARSRVSSGTA